MDEHADFWVVGNFLEGEIDRIAWLDLFVHIAASTMWALEVFVDFDATRINTLGDGLVFHDVSKIAVRENKDLRFGVSLSGVDDNGIAVARSRDIVADRFDVGVAVENRSVLATL